MAALALATLTGTVGSVACVDGPVVERTEPEGVTPAGVVAAEQAGSASPGEEPSELPDTAEAGSTTTKPKPETTTTTEPESPEDPDDNGDDQDGSDRPEEPGDGNGGDDGGTPGVPTGHASSSIAFVNQRRSENGSGALQEDPDLTAMADGWARQMASEGNLYHNPNLFQERPSRYRMVGENVAYNSRPGDIDSAWWNSDGHRANILNSSYTHIGVAFVQDDRGIWWAVQVFAG